MADANQGESKPRGPHRWQPGESGNPKGRPRRPDLFFLAQKAAEEDGVDLSKALWKATLRMLEAAADGDVAAAKLVFDRLTDPDPIVVEDGNTTREEALSRMQAILGELQKRAAT